MTNQDWKDIRLLQDNQNLVFGGERLEGRDIFGYVFCLYVLGKMTEDEFATVKTLVPTD